MNNIQKIFYKHRNKILLVLNQYISYIGSHFKLIKDDYLRELGITDINNLNEDVKNRLCISLYSDELQKQKQTEKFIKLDNICDEMNVYLRYKRAYGPLPVDIKEHIASNVEFFYQIFSEYWLQLISSIVLDQKQDSPPQVFPIHHLIYALSVRSPIVNNTDNGKMIADIEQRFITSLRSINISPPDENLQERRFNELIGLIQQPQQQLKPRPKLDMFSGPGRGSLVGGKRSINYKVQRTTRRPLRRKSSATKRLRRHRRPRRRTARK
jgi:hypothetical protein